MTDKSMRPTLSSDEIEKFIADGFVRVDEAFPASIAEEIATILWRDSGFDRNYPSTWISPYVRLNAYSDPPFLVAANAPRLKRAFDELVGVGRWLPLDSMATFPLRFPSTEPSGDTDWHIDMSFGPATSDTLQWRANLHSDGRALLMLFLFTDVGVDDGPTRLRAGSHFDVARLLAPAGNEGLSLKDLINCGFGQTRARREELATGLAGTVYLCHPFLVHAGQDLRGTRPRFLGQPALIPRLRMCLDASVIEHTPVERVVLDALKYV
jgi:hypothetical protein